MWQKKFELTDKIIIFQDKKLHRIRALIDFDDVKKGDFGGIVEFEHNLSNNHSSWIYDDAKAIDSSYVGDSAKLRHQSLARDFARIMGCSELQGNSTAGDCVEVRGNAVVGGSSVVGGHMMIDEFARVGGYTRLLGDARLRGRAYVNGDEDFISITGIGLNRDTLSAYRCRNDEIEVSVGGVRAGVNEFEKKIIEQYGSNSRYCVQYQHAIQMIKLALYPRNNNRR